MEPEEILKQTIAMIREYAGNDPDKFFRANRFVFARLQLLERPDKVDIKKRLFESGAKCYGCNQPIESAKDVIVHRIDGNRGYSLENCVLMHQECHQKYHKENPSGKGGGRKPSSKIVGMDEPLKILTKISKKYDDHLFHYWWDIAPNCATSLSQYDQIEFKKKDAEQSCYIPSAALMGFLTEERRTTRGEGNWGIKVMKDKPDALAFEPGHKGMAWLYLPVIWEPSKKSKEISD